MPWHPGAGAGCSEQRPGGTVALGYIHTYILGGRYRDAVRHWIRRCAEMKAATSAPSKHRGSGPIARSGIYQRFDDLPPEGTAGVTRFILITMVGRFGLKKGQSDPPPKEAAGRSPDRGAGLGSRYGGGATIPVCGDCPATPQQNRSLQSGERTFALN